MEEQQGVSRRARILRFGAYELDTRTGELYHRGVRTHVQDMPLRVLGLLLERPGELVRHEEFYSRLWPRDELGILEDNLYTAVGKLRQAFQDSARRPRFIETVPKKGYRFIAPVVPVAEPGVADASKAEVAVVDSSSTPAPTAYSRRFHVRPWMAGLSVAVLAGVALGIFLLASEPQPNVPTEAEGGSVAVLPFVNIGGDPGDEYFSDGLTEELIATLSRIGGLRVPARTSSFAFKGKDADIREIGAALGVSAVLEGSVRTEENRIRVTAQLIDVNTGFHYWTEMYDRDLADVFAIQEDLAVRIAEALHRELTSTERGRLTGQPTESLDAYNAYLKGLYFWNQRTGGGLTKAAEYFEAAIAADSGFARAHAGLASVFAPAAELGYVEPSEAKRRMGEAAQRALALDAELPEAHTVQAAYLHVHQWDWAGAERAYLRAIALNPDYAVARQWYAYMLQSLGRFDEAAGQLEIALTLDPLSPLMHSSLASAFRLAGRYDRASAHYRDALELNPDFWMMHEGLGLIHEARGGLELAAEAFEQAAAHAGPTPRPRANLARVFALSGQTAEARRILEQLRRQASDSGNYYPTVATIFEALDEPDGAFDWLEKSYAQRHPHLQRLAVEMGYDRLRLDPRFQDMLQRIGLPDVLIQQGAERTGS